ncbi:MAG TPA: hypothetical protein VGB75_03980 [Jatrophihabitans sp.]|uniref:hypothetical protein n=1 Tax=Jatrophihabitans sp. TaxID=1932789 RepID=UPI002EE4D934
MISEELTRLAARRWWAGGAALAVLAAGLAVASPGGPAQAAVPDRYGFVLWNGSAPVASGTSPAATTVTVLSVGRYAVIFPGQAAAGGVVHVTAVNPAPHWCQVDSFGPSGSDEKALISCYRVGGALDASAFSAVFSSSSGGPASSIGRFGYVDSQPSGALVSQYNSAGAGNTVSHTAVGQWLVKFPGLATPGPVDGSLQSTAVNPQTPARCKVAAWSSSLSGQTVKVSCFNAGGAPLDTQFTLTYQYQRSLYGAVAPPKYFGYLWNTPPLGPPSTDFNSQVGPGANTISSGGVGLSLVQFPMLAAPPDNVEVTAAGSGSEFCGLSGVWFHSGADVIVRNVNCFTNAGAAVNTGFLISANSRN